MVVLVSNDESEDWDEMPADERLARMEGGIQILAAIYALVQYPYLLTDPVDTYKTMVKELRGKAHDV